jgi:hypothetical protein
MRMQAVVQRALNPVAKQDSAKTKTEPATQAKAAKEEDGWRLMRLQELRTGFGHLDSLTSLASTKK